ncbi:MAG: hypothetical protein AAFU64_13345 [Bacteroidota bacterium]
MLFNSLGGERLFEPAAGWRVSRREAITRPTTKGGKPLGIRR